MNVFRNIDTLKDTFDWTPVTINQGFQLRTYRLMYILIGVQHNTNDNNMGLMMFLVARSVIRLEARERCSSPGMWWNAAEVIDLEI